MKLVVTLSGLVYMRVELKKSIVKVYFKFLFSQLPRYTNPLFHSGVASDFVHFLNNKQNMLRIQYCFIYITTYFLGIGRASFLGIGSGSVWKCCIIILLHTCSFFYIHLLYTERQKMCR